MDSLVEVDDNIAVVIEVDVEDNSFELEVGDGKVEVEFGDELVVNEVADLWIVMDRIVNETHVLDLCVRLNHVLI